MSDEQIAFFFVKLQRSLFNNSLHNFTVFGNDKIRLENQYAHATKPNDSDIHLISK